MQRAAACAQNFLRVEVHIVQTATRCVTMHTLLLAQIPLNQRARIAHGHDGVVLQLQVVHRARVLLQYADGSIRTDIVNANRVVVR